MIAPITVGTTAIAAIPVNRKRNSVRFQNNSATQTLYFTRNPAIPSTTNYEFLLTPQSAVFDENNAHIVTNSVQQFNVISSAAGGILAVYETVNT